jgi:hypothetical protein
MSKMQSFKAPIHGQDHDAQVKAWQLVLSIIEGLQDGSYTLDNVKFEANFRLQRLGEDPLSLKEKPQTIPIKLPPRPKRPVL